MEQEKLMMLKTVKQRGNEIAKVVGKLKQQSVKELSITFNDQSRGVVMVNLSEPKLDKIAELLGVNIDVVTIEVVMNNASDSEGTNETGGGYCGDDISEW